MRGPFWNDKTGVTGEPKNYETYTDAEGVLRTRMLDSVKPEDN